MPGGIHAVQAILMQVYVISDGAVPVCVFHRKIASVEADFVIEPMPRRYAHDVFLKTDGRIGGDWDTVKALGLMISQAFLLRACEVIE